MFERKQVINCKPENDLSAVQVDSGRVSTIRTKNVTSGIRSPLHSSLFSNSTRSSKVLLHTSGYSDIFSMFISDMYLMLQHQSGPVLSRFDRFFQIGPRTSRGPAQVGVIFRVRL